MHLGSGALNAQYSINQIQLPSVDKVCDLGVTHDNKLSFGDHIRNAVSINQSINFISRRMTEIQITFAFEIFKINHKLNKIYAKKRKINKQQMQSHSK